MRTTVLYMMFSAVLLLPAQDNHVTTLTFRDRTGSAENAVRTVVWVDGLGRQRQKSVSCPGGYGYSERTDYDERGNISTEWLPVPSSGEYMGGSAWQSAADAFYGQGERPFKSYGYESTAVNRRNAGFLPGKGMEAHGSSVIWRGNGTSGEYSCRILRATSSGIKVGETYSPGTLRVTETVNPDRLRTLTFENRDGRTVLERRIGENETADTRYVYDSRGDLRYVISPEGCRLLPSSGEVPGDIISGYCQCFRYDSWHRLVSSSLPGGGAVEYVYDRYGNEILRSTAVQRLSSEWTITKYDRKLRPAVSGLISLPGRTRADLQEEYLDSAFTVTPCHSEGSVDLSMGYADVSGPAPDTYHMAWFYDDYDFITDRRCDDIKALFVTAAAPRHKTAGRLTGICCSAPWWRELTAFRYDEKGRETFRLTWDFSLNDRALAVATEYDFTGNPVSVRKKIRILSEEMVLDEHTAAHRYEYDPMGNLTKEYVSVDGKEEIKVADNSYDAIGRLAGESVNTEVAYEYDVRSNVSAIRSAAYTGLADYGGGDGTVSSPSYMYVNATTDIWENCPPQKYVYSYSRLGHLRQALGSDSLMTETLETDLDGTVTSVERKYRGHRIQDAVKTMSGSLVTGIRDNSEPLYADAAGRLLPGDYNMEYDADGRMTSDSSRGISRISYHPYLRSAAAEIRFSNNDRIRSDYLPDGTLRSRTYTTYKLQTVTRVTSSGDTVTTVRNMAFHTPHNYHDSFEQTADGWRYHTASGYVDIGTNRPYQYIRNRQGSVMAVVDDNAETVQRTGYYPSGTPYILPSDYKASSPNAMTPVSDRLHIGNIWLGDGGLNLYDNTARLHDPILLSYTSADPNAFDYPGINPYTHCAANPANIIDPLGTDIYRINTSGDILEVTENKDLVQFIIVGDDGKATYMATLKNAKSDIMTHETRTTNSGVEYDSIL